MVQSYDTWQMIHLLIHKANTMPGIIEVFNSLHNYAFWNISFDVVAHTMCTRWHLQNKTGKRLLESSFYGFKLFLSEKAQISLFVFSLNFHVIVIVEHVA